MLNILWGFKLKSEHLVIKFYGVTFGNMFIGFAFSNPTYKNTPRQRDPKYA
jgi:hypothetical protein